MKTRSFVLGFAVAACLQSTSLYADSVYAWGWNYYGQTTVPPGLTNALAIACGSDYSLALSSDGAVSAWGNNHYGACDIPTGLRGVVAIAACDESSLALRADGTVVPWGYEASFYAPLTNLSGVVAVAMSFDAVFAIKADGTVVCPWPPVSGQQSDMPPGLTNVVSIAGGCGQCIALRSDGTVTVWPTNSFGGDPLPPPSGLTNVIAVAAGTTHNLALRRDGTVVAWGNQYSLATNVPSDLTNVVAISAGNEYSLALKADGTVVAWGEAAVPQGLNNVGAICITTTYTGSYEDYYFWALALTNTLSCPPSIYSTSAETQTVGAGSPVFMGVGAGGSLPLSYQWYFQGTNALAGATNRWLWLPHAQTSQSGFYTVVVSNPAGSITSQPLTLNVPPALDIALAPALNLKGAPGSSYRIEYLDKLASTNEWVTLATVTLTNSQQYYCDPSAIGQPARLYRLVQLP